MSRPRADRAKVLAVGRVFTLLAFLAGIFLALSAAGVDSPSEQQWVTPLLVLLVVAIEAGYERRFSRELHRAAHKPGADQVTTEPDLRLITRLFAAVVLSLIGALVVYAITSWTPAAYAAFVTLAVLVFLLYGGALLFGRR